MSASNLNKPIYSTSFIVYSESALGYDALADSTAEVDLGLSAPSTDPYVLADQTKSVSEGLETVLTQPRTRKGAISIARKIEEEEASNTIKLEYLANLVFDVPSFEDLDSPEDDPIIVVDDSDEDEEDEVHTTEDTSIPKSSSPSSLPTELKDLPSKLNELTVEVKGLKKQTLQWELPAEFLSLLAQVASVQAKLNTLDALPSLLLNVTQALNKFAQVLNYASSKARD
ncbi:hypothetical protein Tco_0334957 [Tanacetum coccineum]